MKVLSLLGFMAMVAALVALWSRHALFSPQASVIILQLAAVALMIWARVTFGMRSFHASANPTAGGLVTTGPYHFVRHPIYASICLFLWATVLGHAGIVTSLLGLLGTAGALARIYCEERLLIRQYPSYREYAEYTKRLLPGVW
ncbi:MAG: methyltransferase family protein [Chthoniobacterales bacterium]